MTDWLACLHDPSDLMRIYLDTIAQMIQGVLYLRCSAIKSRSLHRSKMSAKPGVLLALHRTVTQSFKSDAAACATAHYPALSLQIQDNHIFAFLFHELKSHAAKLLNSKARTQCSDVC